MDNILLDMKVILSNIQNSSKDLVKVKTVSVLYSGYMEANRSSTNSNNVSFIDYNYERN